MQQHSRTYNSIANSIYGIAASGITVILNFVVRVFLVRQLGEEINGINSLFQSVVSMMALMEMGISSAMVIHLYEPVKNADQRMIMAIMGFYKRVYNYLALAFSIVVVFVSLFLIDSLVTSSIPIERVRFYFLLFAATFVLNYLTFYKRSLLFAEQKNRISIIITALCEIVFRTLQIIFLLVWQSYVVFLLLLAIERVVGNLICQRYVDKYHPYLRHNHEEISEEKKKAIFKTVRPLMINQTANTLQGAASSIIISILLGDVAIVGYFGVYMMVVSVIRILYGQLGGSFTTSFGSLAVENNQKHMEWTYRRTAFLFNWIACISGSLFIACIDDFVYMMFGPHFVLSSYSVLILTIAMLVDLINIPIISIQNAMGLHRLDAIAMILQAILAVILGYVLGVIWGMPGILTGLLIPTIFLSLFRKGIIISGEALSMSYKKFLGFIGSDILKIFGVVILTFYISRLLTMSSPIIDIVLKALVALGLSIMIPVITSCRMNEFHATIELLSNVAKRLQSRFARN